MASAVERSSSLFSHKSLTTLPCSPGVLFVVSLDTLALDKLLTTLPCSPARLRGVHLVRPVLTVCAGSFEAMYMSSTCFSQDPA